MRIGTRGSVLALAQARQVAELLGGAEVVTIRTSGDRHNLAGDKSRWVDAIEQALMNHEIDLAVHSAKDVPGQLAEGLALLGSPTRAPVEDVICGTASLDQLPHGARVGTSSLRRAAQLRAAHPDLEIVPMRGNVDTRLSKLTEEHLDAIVLARAGLRRLGREQDLGAPLDPKRFVPSPGQGTLALEGRAGDERLADAVVAISDAQTFACLRAERALAAALQATCNTPLGAWCRVIEDGGLLLRAWVGLPNGSAWIVDELRGDADQPEALADALARRMQAVGAAEMLGQVEQAASKAQA